MSICSGLKLLTPGNPKTVKGEKKWFRHLHSFILHLRSSRVSRFARWRRRVALWRASIRRAVAVWPRAKAG